MRKLLIAVFVLLTSCSGLNKKRIFNGYPQTLLYSGNIEKGVEQSLFEFYDKSGKTIGSGNYFDGFKNKQWYYNIEDSLIEIKWAHYKDKKLGFETNIFDFADTVYHGEYNTQIDYKMNGGNITLGVSINNPFNDSLKLIGYEKIMGRDMQRMGFVINHFDSINLGKIKIYSIDASNQEGRKVYTNTAFGFIGNQYLQLSVFSTGEIKKQYNDILFEGVLTNLYLNSQRFYFPFGL